MNEYVTSRVPDKNTTSGWQIALIKIGVVVALPGFLTGAELGSQLGLADAATAIVAGCLVLALICSLTGTVAAKSRLPTATITKFAFGRHGAMVVNAVLAVTLIGWFAVTVELFTRALLGIFEGALTGFLWSPLFVLGGGALMLLTTLFGFRALAMLSRWAVPLMLLVLLVMAYVTATSTSLRELLDAPERMTSMGIAISAVIGGPAAGIVIFPDISRFARSVNHGRAAAVMSYGIGMPLILLSVGVTAIATGEKDLVLVMLGLGLGIPALAFLVLTAWTTNAGNLYSGSIFLSSLLRMLPYRTVAAIAGGAGTGVALLGLTEYFVPFLVTLGITVPPIAGIYVTDFFQRGQKYDLREQHTGRPIRLAALLGWATGVGTAYASATGWVTLTGVPACDSMLVSAAVFYGLSRLFPQDSV